MSALIGLCVLAAGSNGCGQLANGTLDDSHTLQSCLFACEDGSVQQNVPADRVVSIANGANHTLLLLECNSESDEPQMELWGCGDGRHGQLGPRYPEDSVDKHGLFIFRRIDRKILDAADVQRELYVIKSIAASWQSSYLVLGSRKGSGLSRKDIVLSMGGNDFGDLGVDVTLSKAETVHGPHRVIYEAAFPTGFDQVTNIPTEFKVIELGAGTHHVVARIRRGPEGSEDDVLVGWGACRHGQLGLELQSSANIRTTTGPRILAMPSPHLDFARDKVTTFALGNYHTVVLHRSSRVTGMGSNKKGQLFELQHEVGIKSVHCTWNGTYLVFGSESELGEWEVRATGSFDKGQLGYIPVSPANVSPRAVRFPFDRTSRRLIRVTCGSEHVLALFAVVDESGLVEGGDTEVWGWGWNEHGNLGLGHTNDVHLPTKMWPRDGRGTKHVLDIWAGCGTSWIIIEAEHNTIK